MKYENYLVTGAMGFIGSHFCEYLKQNVKIIISIYLPPQLLQHKNFTFVSDSVKITIFFKF